jgi:fatty-acyl-CoA synthase
LSKVSGISLWLRGEDVPWLSESIGETLRLRAKQSGQSPAIHWPLQTGGITTLDYQTLFSAATRLARGLLRHVRPGDAVALCAPNSLEWVLVEHASALAGTVLVPMNPAMGDGELTHILRRTSARVVLTVEEYRGQPVGDRLRAIAVEAIPGLGVIDLPGWAVEADGDASLPNVPAQSRFLIQYTSGTTGRQKGAVLSHESALNASALWCGDWGHSSDDVLVTASPLHHVGASITGLLGTLAMGASIALMPQYDPQSLSALLAHVRGTVLAAVPTMLFDLLDQPDFRPDQLPHLHTVMGGGARVPPETIRYIEAAFGVQFVVTYGQSESPAILQTRRNDPTEVKAGSLGRPLPGRDVRIARADGSTAKDGEIGEICTRSKLRMLEYVGQPEATAEVIDADGWLHTGDLGAMDVEGFVASHGRKRDVVIRGGENIYPDEVENAMLEHPAVAAVAVVGAPDDRFGEVPVGFVVPVLGAEIDAADLTSFGRAKLAAFKIPKRWITVDSFPLTASGKVRKIDLRACLRNATTWSS